MSSSSIEAAQLQRRTARYLSGGALALLVGLGAFGWIWSTKASLAGVREGVEQRRVPSGADREEPILRDIAKTLHRIDERLARLERLATQLQEERDKKVSPD